MMISTIKELIPENEHRRRSGWAWLGITQEPPLSHRLRGRDRRGELLGR